MQNGQIELFDRRIVNKIFCDHIFEKIISLENLFLAWSEFKKGKMRKTDVQNFNLFLENNIFGLYQELKTKTYKHSQYTSFYIKDPKLRHIHKACVRDRVLHHAIFRILYPIFDKSFIFDSYSCRNDKGTHKAINRLQEFFRKESKNNSKTTYVLKLDVRKFFDSIDHDILLSLIKRKIKDEDVIWLIETIINSFSTNLNKGIPLGNITSQLFANIYLNELDYFVKHILKIKYYIRYCDDSAIINCNKKYLNNLILVINTFLNNDLKLFLHPGKIIIRKFNQGIDFLGYVSFPYHRVLRTKTKKRIFKKITSKNFQSYFGILKHCNGYKLRNKLEECI
jgi:RNA-directed DNA polymerase